MMLRSLLQDDPWCQRFQDTLTTLNRLWWLCWDVFISWVFSFGCALIMAYGSHYLPWKCGEFHGTVWFGCGLISSSLFVTPHPATRRAEEAEELEEVRGKMKELQALAVSLRKVPINDGTMFFFEFALAALKTSREAFSWWIWHNAVRRRRGKRKQEINPEGAGLRGSLRSDFSIDMVTWCTMHSYLSKKKLSDGFQLCISGMSYGRQNVPWLFCLC